MLEVIESYNNHLLQNVKCLQSYQKELLMLAIDNYNFGEARHILGMIEGYHEAIKEITDQYTSYNPERCNDNNTISKITRDVCCSTCKKHRRSTCHNMARFNGAIDLNTTWCAEYIKDDIYE